MKGQSVKPLKKNDVKKILASLEANEKKVVMRGIVKFALNTGLRISDILMLKFEDITNYTLKEKKTRKSKSRRIVFNLSCRNALNELENYYKNQGVKHYNKGYLFKSSVFDNKPMTYQGVNYHIIQLKKELNIEYPFNTHSFRKTWARAVYEKYHNIVLIMTLLNHTDPAVTLRYIGEDEETIIKVYSAINF